MFMLEIKVLLKIFLIIAITLVNASVDFIAIASNEFRILR
jgi:hypothetical protein